MSTESRDTAGERMHAAYSLTFWGLYRQQDGTYIVNKAMTIYPASGMFEYRRR